eukprot:g14517.t1 g14517   contig9:2022256-2022852(-)
MRAVFLIIQILIIGSSRHEGIITVAFAFSPNNNVMTSRTRTSTPISPINQSPSHTANIINKNMQATPALSLYIDRGNYRQDLTDDDYHSYNNTNVNPFLPPGFRRVGDQQQQGSAADKTCSTSSSLIDRDALMSSIDAYSAFVNSTRSDGVVLKEVISYNDLDEVNANLISESEQSSSISSTSSIASKTPKRNRTFAI